jgi:hypothetical protein
VADGMLVGVTDPSGGGGDASLEEVDVATGTLRSLGYFSQGILQSGESGLYAFNADDLIVNSTGDSSSRAPGAAIKAPAAQAGRSK